MPELPIGDRTDLLFEFLGIGGYDCQGMMRHILDCLGALRVRVGEDHSGLTPALKEVFRSACNVFLEYICDEENTVDDGSAIRYLLDAFPDDRKRVDGRGWLPLHFAAAIDTTKEEHLLSIARDRPLVAMMTHVLALKKVKEVKERSLGWDTVGLGLGGEKSGDLGDSKNDVEAEGGYVIQEYDDTYDDEEYTSPVIEGGGDGGRGLSSDGSPSRTPGGKRRQTPKGMGLVPLHFICSLRHPRIATLKHLVSINPDAVRVADAKGWLPLHWAARNCSSTVIIEYLLEKFPQSAFTPTLKGQLPFLISMQNRDTDIMECLLRANPDAIDSIDNKGNTGLHEAVRWCNPAATLRLLAHSPALIMSKNFNEQIPIHRLFVHLPDSKRLRWHQLEVLRILIEHTPECVTVKDKYGCVALHLAAYYNTSLEAVSLLRSVYPSATLIYDYQNKLPVHYTTDKQIKRALMNVAEPLAATGITSSFASMTF